MKLDIDIEGLVDHEEVMNQVVKELVSRAETSIVADIRRKVDDAVKTRVDDLLETWLTGDVKVTDEYGGQVYAGKLMELLQKRFDAYWKQNVDSEGRNSDGYGSKGSRIQWLIDHRIADLCETFSKNIAAEVKKQVTAVMSDKLKVAIGGTLIDAIGLPEIVKRLKG
jgi:hypothetical protein